MEFSMRIRVTLGLTILAAIAIGTSYSLSPTIALLQVQKVAPANTDVANISKNAQPSLSNKIVAMTLNENKNEDSREMIIKRYRDALLKISKIVKDSNIDSKKLVNKLLANSEKDKFKGIPTKLIIPITEMHAVIKELQVFDLQADGKTFNDIKKLEIRKPEWINERESQLAKVKLSPKVHEFIAQKETSTSLSDDDVKQVIQLCAKYRDCVELAVVRLMNSNHLLTNSQLNIIKQNIK